MPLDWYLYHASACEFYRPNAESFTLQGGTPETVITGDINFMTDPDAEVLLFPAYRVAACLVAAAAIVLISLFTDLAGRQVSADPDSGFFHFIKKSGKTELYVTSPESGPAHFESAELIALLTERLEWCAGQPEPEKHAEEMVLIKKLLAILEEKKP